MSEDFEELRRRLVVERKRDGRCRYDEGAKAELVAVCGKPGTSVSRVARECGVNANQLSRWIREHRQRQQRAITAPAPNALQATFVPVSIQTVSPSTPARAAPVSLKACLPNGVVVEIREVDFRHFGQVLEVLGGLPCSALMKG